MKKETEKLLTVISIGLLLFMCIMLFVYMTHVESIGGRAQAGYVDKMNYYVYDEVSDSFIRVVKNEWEMNLFLDNISSFGMILGGLGVLFLMYKIARKHLIGEN